MADFGLKIGLEGEKEFKAQIVDINAQFKVLASEMKLVDSEFAKNDTSVEALTARNQVLSKEIESQKQRVEVLKNALDNASKSFGETDKRTLAWKEKLNLAQASLNDMEGELKQNNDKLKDTSEGLEDASKSAKTMGKSVDEAGDKSEDTGSKLKALGTISKAVGAAMAASFAALTATFVSIGKSLVSCTNEASEFADEILTESAVSGIATDKLQAFYYATELLDVSVESLTGSMKKNINSMNQASKGSSTAVEAYAALGVSFEDANGCLRNSEDVYWEVIEALGKVENETERDALAMTLLGKSATDLNPLIEAGKEGFEELADEAKEVGYVMSDDLLQSYGAYDDAIQRLTNSTTNVKHALGTILLPLLTDLATDGTDLLNQFAKGVQDSNGDISKMGEVLGSVLPQFLDKVISYLPEVIKIAATIVEALSKAIINNLSSIIDTATDVIFALISGIITQIPELTRGALKMVMALVDGIIQNLPLLFEVALQVIYELATGIASSLPTLIPTIVSVVLTMVQTLIDNIPMLIDAALQLIIGLATGIINAIPVIIEALPSLITSIINSLINSIPLLIDAGIQLFTALVTNMPVIIKSIVAALPQIITSIINGLKDGFSKISEIGANIVKGIWEGIKNTASWLADNIKNWADGLVGGIKDFLGIHSPSRVFAEIGSFMGQGLSEGFTDSMKQTEEDMVNAIPTDFDINSSIGDVNSSVSPLNKLLNVTIPLTIDGKTLAKTIAEIQWTQNEAFVRNLG